MAGSILFGFGLLILIVGLIASMKFFKAREKAVGAGVLAVVVLIAGALIIGSMLVTVDTKKVGVVTSFKRPTGEIRQAGAGMVAPWESVTEMDAAKQTVTYRFDVQLAGGAQATLDVYPSWRMNPDAAPELFQDYKTFDNVVDSLWKQQLIATSNNLFGNYNPLTNVDPKTGKLIKTKEEWSKELKTALEANPLIQGRLIIDSLSIPTIAPDKNTQDNLNKIVAEFARGSVLEQQKANALKQKEITETNAKVPFEARCLEIAAANGGEPGLCGRTNTGVIINSGK